MLTVINYQFFHGINLDHLPSINFILNDILYHFQFLYFFIKTNILKYLYSSFF